MKEVLLKPQKRLQTSDLQPQERESPLLYNSRMAMLWYATQGCRPATTGASHLVADVLMGQVPLVVTIHVLIAQPASHDQPSSTTSAHTHTHTHTHFYQ